MTERIVVAVTLLMAFAALMFVRGASTHGFVEVSVVPRDAAGLSCEGEVAGLRCAPDPKPLQPFMTTGGKLVALPGVFEMPNVAQWLAHPKEPMERVRIWCEAERLATGVPVRLRFSTNDAFAEQLVDVANVQNCFVR